MRGKVKALFVDLVVPIFYRVRRVEYMRFARQNEYLILYYERRIPLLSREHVVVNSSIGHDYGRFFERQTHKLRKVVSQIETRELSLQEFAEAAKHHSHLKDDPWVKEDLPKILELIRHTDTR
jgi:hypothetical protein